MPIPMLAMSNRKVLMVRPMLVMVKGIPLMVGGIALTLKQWGRLEKLKPLTIRFDMPLYLSRPTALQPEPWQFRWVLGIGRTF